MANYLGRTLSRLVRRRAYLAGNIFKLEEQAEEVRRALAAAERVVLDARQDLATLDAEIEAESGIHGEDIRPIRHVPRGTIGQHGTFLPALVEILKETGGPIDMRDLVGQMALRFSVTLSTAAERDRFGSIVRRAMNKLRLKEAVVRLPAARGEKAGVWCWIDD